MIAIRPLCASSQCVLPASVNMMIRLTGAFMRSPMPALSAAPSCDAAVAAARLQRGEENDYVPRYPRSDRRDHR